MCPFQAIKFRPMPLGETGAHKQFRNGLQLISLPASHRFPSSEKWSKSFRRKRDGNFVTKIANQSDIENRKHLCDSQL